MSRIGKAVGWFGRVTVGRAVAFLSFWLILVGGADRADRPAVVLAIVLATWASLRLLPPGDARVSVRALARLIWRFLRQSLVAGVDVAWRALDPRLPLRPGFVAYPTRLPPGPARNAFCTLASLAPGTLPTGPNESGAILVHCLDVGQPIACQLVADEALLTEALGRGRGNG